jgi:hypothetical protein
MERQRLRQVNIGTAGFVRMMKTLTKKLACAAITIICAAAHYGGADASGVNIGGVNTKNVTTDYVNTDNTSTDNANPARFFDRVDFLTEYYLDQDLRTFLNHKNEEFRSAYLMSAETRFEMMLLSYGDFLHFGLLYTNYLGMGRQNAAILFDPQEADYAIVPFLEFRRGNLFYQTGLDHRCFHEIDRLTRPTAYWNQIYIKASSANYRYQQMRKNYVNARRDNLLDMLSWSVRAGYFIRKFGGMDVTLLSGGHPWASTAGGDVGYSFHKTKSWMFTGRNSINLLIDTTGTPYWTGILGLDADVYNRKHTFGLFVKYNYEFPRTLPLFSRDRLLELGMRFRY